jgi:hypothetical protein
VPIYRFTITSLDDDEDTDAWDVEAPDKDAAYDKAFALAFTAGWSSMDSKSTLTEAT